MLMSRRAVTTGLVAMAASPTLALGRAAPSLPTRGFAIPGWVSAEPRAPAPALLARLRQEGFETVRLPIDLRDIDDDPIGQIRILIRTLADFGFITILDLHMGDAAPGDIRAAWRLLAPLVGDTDPALVLVELLNEPQLETAQWVSLRDDIAATVRSRAPAHTLLWGPARVQGIWELDHEPPLADGNSIAVIHYYWPMGFTHQCESWMGSAYGRFSGLPFPAGRRDDAVEALAVRLDADDRAVLDTEFAEPWAVASIDAHFAQAAAWSRRHGVPLVLGEFGASSDCTDPRSRATWTRAVREAAEAHGMGWLYWELDRSFGFVADRTRSESADDGLIEALLS